MFITLLLIVVLLPDTINIGRTMFAGHAASAEAIKQVENQGQMTSAIASIVVDYLEDRGFEECGYASNQVRNCYEIYGTSDQRGLNSENPSVTAMVVTKYRPFILHLVPNMRWGDRIAFEDGIVSMNSVRVGSAASFIRE
ncbi:hypothetical protein M3202_21305 [Alkalihalobacillus oceani]|uniref:Uncharacterized protein n=1 Tax=Halalkalibacter oceani TaxID=1653776 RepID=A0A9X2IQQ2_9BACI|nr:hypothetical protein [Halalkalibacter oceani]MCM3716585.1 hypothetical protein [Halalkalibacter oceani]